jgi:hyperosmotically inducible periplasmic protein
MKSSKLSIPLMCFTALLASSCIATKNTGVAVGNGAKAAAGEVRDTATDASITAAIKMKMADDPVVSAMKIDVDTVDGAVTLNGTVQDMKERDKAVGLAKSVDGVKSVDSKLVVRR